MQQQPAGLNDARNCCTPPAMEFAKPRALDHLVLPTRDLKVARHRFEQLGFTVAPDGHHPFGTSNCCVYFSNGTFIEPLAVTDGVKAEASIRAANVFVARDRQFRDTAGEDGLSAVVLGTDDAQRDHRQFEADGVSAGPVLAFSRPFIDADGKSDVASFRLAFAAEEPSDETFFFTCQRIGVPAVDRSALQRHRNGVTRIDRIVFSSSAPEEHIPFLSTLLGTEPSMADENAVFFALANAEMAVLSEDGDEAPGEARLFTRALKFHQPDTLALVDLLTEAEIPHDLIDERVIVPPAPGQGVFFIFESQP